MESDKYIKYTDRLADEFEKVKEQIDLNASDLNKSHPYKQLFVIHKSILLPIVNNLSDDLKYNFSCGQIVWALAEVIINRTPH